MTSTNPIYPHHPSQANSLGLMFLFAAITAAAPLATEPSAQEQTSQTVTIQFLVWDNDDDPDEGGQRA